MYVYIGDIHVVYVVVGHGENKRDARSLHFDARHWLIGK